MKEDHYNHIISSLIQGDDQVMGDLYDYYADALFGIINRIIPDRDTAADCLQDVFVKIWKNGKKYDPEKGRLFTWMSRIARNTALNLADSKNFKNLKKIQSDEKLVSIDANNYTTRNTDEWMDLKGIVGQLPLKYQEVIVFCYFKGYTQKEVSEELNVPLGTVKTRIKDALKQLNKIYNYEASFIIIMLAFGVS